MQERNWILPNYPAKRVLESEPRRFRSSSSSDSKASEEENGRISEFQRNGNREKNKMKTDEVLINGTLLVCYIFEPGTKSSYDPSLQALYSILCFLDCFDITVDLDSGGSVVFFVETEEEEEDVFLLTGIVLAFFFMAQQLLLANLAYAVESFFFSS
ncbi:unnamed protein product [Ilex paraguariensis]|uniref:Uncharacterized protein n=1 Tax=Ilex paraguariensis TaxID=185542 RepID=A0ABC8UP62_9AQUA